MMGATPASTFPSALFPKRTVGFWIIPALLLLVGWGGSGVLMWLGHQRQVAEERSDVARLAGNAEASLVQRLTTYTDELQAAAAFLRASHSVERDEWREYAATIALPTRYPGIRGIGVIYPVAAADRARFLRNCRSDGVPDFAFHAVPGHRLSDGDMAVITFIEPQESNAHALGLDVLSESNRREAALTARDSGQPQLTRRIALVQVDRDVPGSLLLVPVYAHGEQPRSVAQRRATFVGWVYAPLLIEELVTSAIQPRHGRLQFALFEGTSASAGSLLPFTGSVSRRTVGAF